MDAAGLSVKTMLHKVQPVLDLTPVLAEDRKLIQNIVSILSSLSQDKLFHYPSITNTITGYAVTYTLPRDRDFDVSMLDMDTIYNHVPGRIQNIMFTQRDGALTIKLYVTNINNLENIEEQVVHVLKRRKR